MLKKSGLVLLLGVFSTVAQAQSLDGVYRGTFQITKGDHQSPHAPLVCPVGTRYPIEFRVSGLVITISKTRAGIPFSAPIASDGSFKIFGSYYPGGPARVQQQQEWSGLIKGVRIDGSFTGIGQGGDCYGKFSARR